jgi:hypothetical protein
MFGFDSQRYQIFCELVGLERGPLRLVSTTEELLERKSSGSGLENRDYGRRGSAALTTRHTIYPQKLTLTSPTKRRLLRRYSSLAGSGHVACLLFCLLTGLFTSPTGHLASYGKTTNRSICITWCYSNLPLCKLYTSLCSVIPDGQHKHWTVSSSAQNWLPLGDANKWNTKKHIQWACQHRHRIQRIAFDRIITNKSNNITECIEN